MIVYNVTTKVHESIADEWLAWMKTKHIPEIIATGCFSDAHIFRLLEIDEEEGPTYAVQYHATSPEKYAEYMDKHVDGLRKDAIDKWGERIISFRSLLEKVH